MKRIVLVLLLIVLLAAAWYGYTLYTGKVPSLTEVKADASIGATELIAAFERDSAQANKQYLGKILLVSGKVRAVDKETATIVLGEAGSPSSVRCSMDSSFVKNISGLNEGSQATVKGACTGYMADETGLGLGSDVILNRCVIEEKNKSTR